MILTLTILVSVTLLGGLAVQFLGYDSKSIRLPLVFAGSYLFSVTLIHILPELFSLAGNPFQIGLFVLVGFFFQQVLEYFTSGVEHGHFHDHQNTPVSKLYLFIGLALHSLMEGALLTHASPFHDRTESYSLLLGIVLHKAPAAFALMAVFKNGPRLGWPQLLVLIGFSLISPIGMLMSSFLIGFSQESLLVLFAIVSGGFLHISTTIFVESSPHHEFRVNRILIMVLAAFLAIVSEMFL